MLSMRLLSWVGIDLVNYSREANFMTICVDRTVQVEIWSGGRTVSFARRLALAGCLHLLLDDFAESQDS